MSERLFSRPAYYVTDEERSARTPHLLWGWGPEWEPGSCQAQLKEGGPCTDAEDERSMFQDSM